MNSMQITLFIATCLQRTVHTDEKDIIFCYITSVWTAWK